MSVRRIRSVARRFVGAVPSISQLMFASQGLDGRRGMMMRGARERIWSECMRFIALFDALADCCCFGFAVWGIFL